MSENKNNKIEADGLLISKLGRKENWTDPNSAMTKEYLTLKTYVRSYALYTLTHSHTHTHTHTIACLYFRSQFSNKVLKSLKLN